ncbi:anthranilate phosphoribosyltransferase protein [Marine Group I thaumarchaeote SCGC AAA799-B03]|uniref:Anthranilate phosphoribosyltransferase protein n=4 Tax=Marine Group I TaxID=905826 RepID=A0A087S713_9ARCH|nr:anthranilate phosphoribosyltransferase protein [Marine Group I thaumarchaeote SCGC AAA799-N04]KFM15526.1 anthranilate phosphoribosyltransferase protein [Marine Group I thaumarchaeote SCGC AAA799-D11]KFM19253.1 anthranilate phosphoribosyltransferase protein [Marine Group I thaumarchaeote SCGC RSA3]KFM21517.1 anthranilate phosphoribosyltransferase protein [Marine Group I thaumarchaeote SCGC AAA799-B03]
MDTAFVLVNCDLGSEEDVINDLKHIESIKEICGTFGAYDIVAKIENADREKVRDTITWNIRKIPHVRSTLTLVGIPGQS